MTDEEINLAIAKICGLKILSDGITHTLTPCDWYGAYHPDGKLLKRIPRYCRDLNAMYEAEKVFTGEQWVKYVRLLGEATQEEKGRCHATARQRAEAFLKTLNLWKE